MTEPIKIVSACRQVIESRLLAALDDKSKVAVLLCREDLIVLINALEMYGSSPGATYALLAESLAKDLQTLERSAFP